jgi:hypothetical protein
MVRASLSSALQNDITGSDDSLEIFIDAEDIYMRRSECDRSEESGLIPLTSCRMRNQYCR